MRDPADIGWYLVLAEFVPEMVNVDKQELGARVVVPLVLWFNPAATPKWWAGRPGKCLPLGEVWTQPPKLLVWEILPPSAEVTVRDLEAFALQARRT
jgi:hypothetical protein